MRDICRRFTVYLSVSESVFDIMAATYKLLDPFENEMLMIQDDFLKDAICRFSESQDDISAIESLRHDLIQWSKSQRKIDAEEIRHKLFYIIRLIDSKCAPHGYECRYKYTKRFSLNELLQDEITILPRFESILMKKLGETIRKAEGYGFYGRNYARTADVSGSIHNFIIFKAKERVKPIINIPRDYKEIQKHFEKNEFRLKIGLFPFSNKNIYEIFEIQEVYEDEGVFSIEKPLEGQEELLFERCKKALLKCKEYDLDIAVFPEMLLTKTVQNDIIRFVKKSNDLEGQFPRFMWLGTAWSAGRNTCIVIDRYGNIVFEQHKFIPYAYTKAVEGNKKVTIREGLLGRQCSEINFLEIPGVFRMATAICRDISDYDLTALLKEGCCNAVIIPAFSKTDRLVAREITPLALEHVMTVVCNACSSLCEEEQHNWRVSGEMTGKVLPFCFVCMPGKGAEDNAAVYHNVCYSEACKDCERYCHGHFFTISLKDYVCVSSVYTAKVEYVTT